MNIYFNLIYKTLIIKELHFNNEINLNSNNF